MNIPKEVKAEFLKSLQGDWLKCDCDIRWLRTQLVNPEVSKDEELTLHIKSQLKQLESQLKAFEQRIDIQNNLP